MLIIVSLLAAMLASPLDQPPIPHCLRHPSQESPHPVPPPSEGPRIGGETRSDDLRRPRVSTSPSLSKNKQGEMGGNMHRGLAGDGSAPSLPPPWGWGGRWTSPCPSHPLYLIRLLSRLGLTANTLSLTNRGLTGVREARIEPALALPSLHTQTMERMRERDAR